ncbi:hypothetical protein NIES4073_60000 [Kalymmatonema gypsitolerans NIES-4073]|nr:hypothetical protein NIES4073_60000 [Scytonema sp. NIES-4073]
MKFWYFSFNTLCFASSFILPYLTAAPLTLWEATQRASTSFDWLCLQFNRNFEFTEAKV